MATTERDLVLNAIVVDPVLADPAIHKRLSRSDNETAEARLRANLTVIPAKSRSQMMIAYEDRDPQAAALVCNAIAESYLRMRDTFDNARVSNLERWIEPEMQRWEQEVEAKQLRVATLSKQTGGAGVDTAERARERLDRLGELITDLEIEVSVLEAIEDTPERELDALKTRLEVTRDKHDQQRSEIAAVLMPITELEFAKQELEVDNEVLLKLRERVAVIRTERRRDGAVRSLASAVPPATAIDGPRVRRLALYCGTAFLIPYFAFLFLLAARNLKPE